MPIDWQPLVAAVQSCSRFVLTTHVRPDGDGIGSMKALAEGLRQRGKHVRMVISGHAPPRYDFMDPEKEIISYTPPPDAFHDADAMLVLDTGTWNQLADVGPMIQSLPATTRKLVLDHHVTQDELSATRLVDTSAEATGRLVFEALKALGCTFTPTIATQLFVALAMDTGWFRHSNTKPATLEMARDLVAFGAVPEKLYQLLFERSTVGRLKLIGRVLDRLTLQEGGRLAFSSIIKQDYETTGATPQDSEDLVNYTLSVQGVEAGLLFMEQPRGGIKVSFRSRGVNLAKVAESFGGGGHAQAAGAIVQSTMQDVQERVIKAVKAVLA